MHLTERNEMNDIITKVFEQMTKTLSYKKTLMDGLNCYVGDVKLVLNETLTNQSNLKFILEDIESLFSNVADEAWVRAKEINKDVLPEKHITFSRDISAAVYKIAHFVFCDKENNKKIHKLGVDSHCVVIGVMFYFTQQENPKLNYVIKVHSGPLSVTLPSGEIYLKDITPSIIGEEETTG
jgi:hypothetical protein